MNKQIAKVLVLHGISLLVLWYLSPLPVGDSQTWERLANSSFIMGSEPLGRLSHYFAWLVCHDSSWAPRLASIWGGLCLTGFFLGFGFRRWWLLLSSPFVIFFLAYPSTCPWAYFWLTSYLVLGIFYLEIKPNRLPWIEGLVLGIGCATHGMILFATAAQIVLVWSWNRNKQVTSSDVIKALVCLALPFIPLVAILTCTKLYGLGLAESPWYGNALGGIFHTRWVHFGSQDWRVGPFTNFKFMGTSYLLGLAFIAGVFYSAPILMRLWPKGEVGRFLGIATIGCLVLTFFWNPDWGYLADMRFAALASVPCEIALVYQLTRPKNLGLKLV